MTAIDESHCARCLRIPGPQDLGYEPDDDTPPVDCEVLTDPYGEAVGVICPDCITPEEQQAIDEDTMDMADLADSGEDDEDDEL